MAEELKAGQLSDGLQGSIKDRMEGERTILLTMIPGKRPDVVLTGFWTGKFIRAAMDSIAKAYRLRRYKPTRTPTREDKLNSPKVGAGKGGTGDGRTN